MIPGVTARTVLAVPAAALLDFSSLPPASAQPSAATHAVRHAEAAATSVTEPCGAKSRDGAAVCRCVGGTARPVRPFDQHSAAECAPQPSDRRLPVARTPAAANKRVTLGAGHHSSSRSSTASFPAEFTFFRC